MTTVIYFLSCSSSRFSLHEEFTDNLEHPDPVPLAVLDAEKNSMATGCKPPSVRTQSHQLPRVQPENRTAHSRRIFRRLGSGRSAPDRNVPGSFPLGSLFLGSGGSRSPVAHDHLPTTMDLASRVTAPALSSISSSAAATQPPPSTRPTHHHRRRRRPHPRVRRGRRRPWHRGRARRRP